jgi:hypothetical protein
MLLGVVVGVRQYRLDRDVARNLRGSFGYAAPPPPGFTEVVYPYTNARGDTDGFGISRGGTPANPLAFIRVFHGPLTSGRQFVETWVRFMPASEGWALTWSCEEKHISGLRYHHGNSYRFGVGWYPEPGGRFAESGQVRLGSSGSSVTADPREPDPDYVKLYRATGEIRCPPPSDPDE